MPPRTTKRRTTTNVKTKNNQNCQKIELYGSPTTKELKKKLSSRLVGGVGMAARVMRTSGKVAAGGLGRVAAGEVGDPAFVCGKTRKNNQGVREITQSRVPVWGNKASKSLTEKTCGDCGGRRNSQLLRRVCWRDPQGPRMCTKPPTWESAPEGPSLLVGSGESD